MIDNIAAPLPAPSTNPIVSSPAPSGGSQSAAAPDTGTSAAESFASTLQSRMQQASANKSTPRDHLPNGKPAAPTDIDALLALNAEKAVNPTNPVALAALAAHENGDNTADAVLAAVTAKLAAKDKTKPEPESDTPSVAPDLGTQGVIPTAANVIAATPAPSTSVVATVEKQSTSSDVPSASTAVKADGDTAAILAANSDKNAAVPANPDKPKEGDFADLLKNNAPVANVAAHTPHVANVAATVTREVREPISSSQWSSDVGNQVSWMVSQRESRADLVLNPPQLGRIEVSIALNGDQATANFVSPNADVRDALQGSLPRLREILADAGVFLGQANIGAESFQQNGNGAEKGTNSYGESISSGNETLLGSSGRSVSQSPMGVMRGQGLIDLFA